MFALLKPLKVWLGSFVIVKMMQIMSKNDGRGGSLTAQIG